MNKAELNWLIVAGFFLLFAVIIGLFITQGLQPLNKKQLRSHLRNLHALIPEAELLLNNKNKTMPQYYTSHLNDIIKKTVDMCKSLNTQKYTQEVVTKRNQTTEICTDFQNTLHTTIDIKNAHEETQTITLLHKIKTNIANLIHEL